MRLFRGLGAAAGSVFCCAERGPRAARGLSALGGGSQSSTHFPGQLTTHFTTAVINRRSLGYGGALWG